MDTWKMNDIKKIDDHCNPCITETVDPSHFFTSNQDARETTDIYIRN